MPGKRPYHRKQPGPFRKDRVLVNGNRHQHHDPHSDLVVPTSHQLQRDPTTLSNFSQSMLRISTLHILQSAGYDAVQSNSMTVLVDCLGRYLAFLAESAKEFAELSGRSQITAFDVADGLFDAGIDLSELKEWLFENGGESLVATTISTEQTLGTTNANDASANSETSISVAAQTATGAGSNVPNRPVLPIWKGADPGLVMNDLLWNGRTRDVSNRDIYEWHAVPEGFDLPETEEEQDEFAYPDGSDVEEAVDKDMPQEKRKRVTRWIPESKPMYIPDYMPPFPGSAIPQEELDDEEDEDMGMELNSSLPTDIFNNSSAAHAISTPTMGSTTSESGKLQDKGAHPDLSKLSIGISQTSSDVDRASAQAEASKQSDINPYINVVPLMESSPLVSALYTAIPSRKSLKQQRSKPTTGLSQEAQQLFSDTLQTLLDPAPYPSAVSKRLKRQSRLAHVIARPGELSDTLFSNVQHAGMIDTLLKQSAPSTIMNKFANPGVSVQDALSPVMPSERVMNGGAAIYSEYHAMPDSSRSTLAPGGSRKGSFSSSPLSNVTYPPQNTISAPVTSSGVSSSTGKQKQGSRKSSLAGLESVAPSPAQLQSSLPSGVLSQAAPAGTSTTTTKSVQQAPINPSILSRIGSNFDPAALLAAHGTSATPAEGNRISTVNGDTPAAIPLASTPVPITSPAPVSLSKVNSSVRNDVPAASKTVPSSVTPSTLGQAQAKVDAVSKPVPGPISLSDLPLPTSSNAISSAAMTPSIATPTTPSVPAAPKIRFKFSLSSTGDQETASSSTSVKREHGQHSSSSNHHHHHHHHRSSSITSTSGSSHHKKSKKSSRDYDFDDEDEEGRAREKKKKKSKSKDKDRDRERDRDRDSDADDYSNSSRHKHHKHHKSHRHGSSFSNGVHSSSGTLILSSSAASSSSHSAPHQAAEDSQEVIDCICSDPTLDDGLFMIACDSCQVWFHGRCVGIREGDNVGTWYCRRCALSGRI
ncbi:hypothetical protein EDD11_008486 [Mortierella claussenii]|nr:hypothetical protein EDD11_008486 [Mortierella claussenii]